MMKIAHHPGFPTASNVFHIQMTKKIPKTSHNAIPINGIQNPINNKIGHQCIFAIFLAMSAGPTAGIHAMPAGPVLVFLAIAMNAREL